MSEDNNQQNGNAANGDVPEIELIIKVSGRNASKLNKFLFIFSISTSIIFL